MVGDLQVDASTQLSIGGSRCSGVQRQAHPHIGLRSLWRWVRPVGCRHATRALATQSFDGSQTPLYVQMRGRGRQNHPRRVFGVTRQIALRHGAAEALAEHHRLRDAQRIAQPHHVVNPMIKRPFFAWPLVAATLTAVVDIDELRDVCQL